jgi:hypothetical protein
MKLLLALLLLPWLPLATLAAGEEPDFVALIAQLAATPGRNETPGTGALAKRRDAGAQLWALGEAAWPSLRQAVAEGEDLVATAAASLLAVQQDRQSLPAIIARLRRAPAAMAPAYAQAAVALAVIDGPQSLGPLHDAALGEAGDFRLPLAAALLALPPENYAKLTGRGEDARAKLDARSPAGLTVVPLVPKAFETTAGANGAIAPDGTVTVTGPRTMDTYTLKAVAPAGGKIIGFILEAIPDPSLPKQGPGRADDGSFVLSRFAVSFGPAGGADTPTAVKFAGREGVFVKALAHQPLDRRQARFLLALTRRYRQNDVGDPRHVFRRIHRREFAADDPARTSDRFRQGCGQPNSRQVQNLGDPGRLEVNPSGSFGGVYAFSPVIFLFRRLTLYS